MLFVLFQLGGDHYAIAADRVVEVLPLLHVKAVPHAPAGVSGLVNYRGAAVPVVDVTAVALGLASAPRLSTRLLLVRRADAADRLLGLVVERATGMARFDPARFAPPAVRPPGAPYLGPVATDSAGRLVQWIEIEQLLPAAVLAALPATLEAAR